MDYDKEFRVLAKHEIVEDFQRKRFPAFNVEGLEDCRIFEYKIDFGSHVLLATPIHMAIVKSPFVY